MIMQKMTTHHIALAGEFAVLSQLALHGFDANMTLGNTKSVDILISNPRTGKMSRLEVKTHSHNKEYKSKTAGRVVGQWRMRVSKIKTSFIALYQSSTTMVVLSFTLFQAK